MFAPYAGNKKRRRKLIDKKEERLGPGAFLIKTNKVDELKKIFEKYGLVNYSVKRLWGH